MYINWQVGVIMSTERALDTADRLLLPWTIEASRPEHNHLHVNIGVANLFAAVQRLSSECWGDFDRITDLDMDGEADSLELVYYFSEEAAVLTVGIYIPRHRAVVPSICHLFPVADSYERLLTERLGIQFVGFSVSNLPDDTGSTTTADPSPPYKQWVQSILSRDPDAWTELHEHYSGQLQHDIQISLRKWGMALDIADDIEQDTWLTAVKKIGEFTWVDEDRFYHWLRSISCNHIRTYRRQQSRYVSFDDSEDEDDGVDDFMDQFMEAGEGVEAQVVLRERMAALDRVLRTLPPRDREILVRRMMGETPRELAAEYGLKPEHVRTILLRSKKKLDDQIGPEDDSDE